MPKQPLAEVFGFPVDNLSPEAENFRAAKLCPYNNKVPSCTKVRANDPLGVCSLFDSGELAIICPVRFRQNWLIVQDAAKFFFPKGTPWTTLVEIRLDDKDSQSAGNIDIVLVSYDEKGRITDFGALEVQAVYISGNIRRPFDHYMENPRERSGMDWSGKVGYPNPDYLSSSRKRLAPQLIYKGGILNYWNKKIAVALHSSFYKTLPKLPEVAPEKANLAWFVYDLQHDIPQNRYNLTLTKTVYTDFQPALEKITTPEPGPLENFIDHLQGKLDEKLGNENNPDAPTLLDVISDEP